MNQISNRATLSLLLRIRHGHYVYYSKRYLTNIIDGPCRRSLHLRYYHSETQTPTWIRTSLDAARNRLTPQLYSSCYTSKRFIVIDTVNTNLSENVRDKPSEGALSFKDDDDLLSYSPGKFADFLRHNKISRCYVLYDKDSKKAVVSHPELERIANWLNSEDNLKYRKHEAIFFHLGVRTGILMAAFIWRTNRGQACGGIRLQNFLTMEKFIGDGLWLSHRLGIKSSLAGLWIGGGKGFIAEPPNREHYLPEFRQKMFYDFGDFVSSLNGCYVAGIDLGVHPQDLYNVHSRSRWTVCIPEDIGGSGSPAKLLGKGIVCAMEAALDHLKRGTLERKSVAIQGAGAVGFHVATLLLERGASLVYVTEINQKRAEDIRDTLTSKLLPRDSSTLDAVKTIVDTASGRLKVDKVDGTDKSIFKYDCDIISPCAVGNVLTKETIPKIQAKVICGSANGQLEQDDDFQLIREHGIAYVLEYLPNRMAIVNSAFEAYGRMPGDPIMDEHFNKHWKHSIYVLTKKVLEDAEKENISVLQAAIRLADVYSKENHPLWPGRCQNIILGLKESGWHKGHDFWRKRSSFAIAEGCA